MNFKLSQVTKKNIKSRFEQLHGIYTKTIAKDNKVSSYIARCDCPQNDQFVVIVHKECNNDKNDKYLTLANCITKGIRYIKKAQKNNLKLPVVGETIIVSSDWSDDFKQNIYPKISQYEKNFIKSFKQMRRNNVLIVLWMIGALAMYVFVL